MRKYYNTANYQDITCTPFASKETMLGLIVTISSTLEIIDYLKEKFNYSYILTAKLNQDCLEVCQELDGRVIYFHYSFFELTEFVACDSFFYFRIFSE